MTTELRNVSPGATSGMMVTPMVTGSELRPGLNAVTCPGVLRAFHGAVPRDDLTRFVCVRHSALPKIAAEPLNAASVGSITNGRSVYMKGGVNTAWARR